MADAVPLPSAPSPPVIALEGVRKSFGSRVVTEVLHGIDLELRPGEFTALMGPSGSGKSTLLHLLGLLDPPTEGRVLVQGRETSTLTDDERTRVRGRTLGFVFQFHHLLPEFTALENVMMPMIAAKGRLSPDMSECASGLLREIGLGDLMKNRATDLSGGQQQRVAIARALAMAPALVLADEPTGNLDTETGEQVFELMRRFNHERRTAFLVVTHDSRIADRCDRVLELVDGRMRSDRLRERSVTSPVARALFLALAAALSAAPAPGAEPAPAAILSAPSAIPDALIRARAGTYMDHLGALGYSGAVLILRNGRPVLERAWGFADRGRGIRADTRSVWNLGSITKQFTAAAILRLEEQGKLRTADSITRWFPDAPGPKRAITVHHLLTHTAGFESDYATGDYVPNTRAEYMGRMLAAPLQSPPGTEYSYANSGYSMLAAIIELVTGKDYETALTELVLAPAGMTETGYLLPRWAPARIVHGYRDGGDWGTIVDRLKVPGAPFWALRGNGGLATTLADMTRWERALTSSVVLTASSRLKFMTGYVSEGGPGVSRYAYGWAVHPSRRGTRVVEHNGGNGVYVAEFRRLVDEGITIFVTSSVDELSATPVIDALESLVFGGRVELPPAVVAMDPRRLAAFAGRWRTAGGEALDVEAEDGHLLVRAGGPDAWLLLKVGDTAQSARDRELGERALAIWRSASGGDAKPLFDALKGSEPLDRLTEQVKSLAADRAGRLGALREVSLLGSVRRDRGLVVSTVRLDYERGVVSNVMVWGPDGVLRDWIARPLARAVFVPVGAAVLERFDLSGGPPDPAVRLEQGRATGEIALVAPNGQRVVFTRPSPRP